MGIHFEVISMNINSIIIIQLVLWIKFSVFIGSDRSSSCDDVPLGTCSSQVAFLTFTQPKVSVSQQSLFKIANASQSNLHNKEQLSHNVVVVYPPTSLISVTSHSNFRGYFWLLYFVLINQIVSFISIISIVTDIASWNISDSKMGFWVSSDKKNVGRCVIKVSPHHYRTH